MNDTDLATVAELGARVTALETLLAPLLRDAERRAAEDQRQADRRRAVEAELDELNRKRSAVEAMLPNIEERARTQLKNGIDNFETVRNLHDTTAELRTLDQRIATLVENLHR